MEGKVFRRYEMQEKEREKEKGEHERQEKTREHREGQKRRGSETRKTKGKIKKVDIIDSFWGCDHVKAKYYHR